MGKWIGVDLDGTLAEHDKKAGSPIGKPLRPMLKKVKKWIKEGREVRIFTARAESSVERIKIKSWLKKQGLPDLAVTNKKDWEMQELWDDRAIRVEHNTGNCCSGCQNSSKFNQFKTDC